MSTPATTPGVPAASAPPAAPVPPAEAAAKSAAWASIRARVLGGKTKPPAETPPPTPPAAPAAAAPGAPAAPAAPAAPPAGDPPPAAPRVRKVLKEAPPLPAAPAAPPPPAAPAAPAAAAPPVDPEVQREIDLAAFAARRNPDKYAGMDGRVKGFFTAQGELLAAKSKELGGDRSPEFRDYLESDEFKAWQSQNRPSYHRGDRTKLAEDMVADRARAEARSEMAPEFKALERKTAELQHAPMIEAQANAALRIMLNDPHSERDPALVAFAANPAKFGEDHPEEARIIAEEANQCVELVKEVIRLDRDLVDFNPRAPTPQQKIIREFSLKQNASLREKHPNGIPMADDSILIDAETYERLGLHRDPKYRVFNAQEIVGMLAATRNSEMLQRLSVRRVGVSKSIYATPAIAPASGPSGQPPASPEPPASPAAPTSAAPGSRGAPPTNAWKEIRRKALAGK